MTRLEENGVQIGAEIGLNLSCNVEEQVSSGKYDLISVMNYNPEEIEEIDALMELVNIIDEGLKNNKPILDITETRLFLNNYKNLLSDRLKKHFEEAYKEFLLIFLVEKINQYLDNSNSDKAKLSENLNELISNYPNFDLQYFYVRFSGKSELLDKLLKKMLNNGAVD